ncbi:MAG: helix-turn-helix transcriptional regulator [Deltaproteobacteria bacterium]|nr:helix-turn-helix transcriptional regulator [Deltaproteobacteria bacterium]
MSTDIQQLNLGRKIRRLRESRGKTLREFGLEVGIDYNLLEKIEKNEIYPPVATLLNVAHACGRELGYFFDVSEEDKSYSLVKKGKAQKAPRVYPRGKNPLSYTFHTLAPEKIAKKMEPFLVEFLPKNEEVPPVAHDGEEFIYVLEGNLEFRLQDERVKLGEGDSLYFESKYPHAFRALGGKKGKAIVVLYPH